MKKPYSFRLDPELIEQLRKQAKKERRSLANTIEMAIIKYLNPSK